MELVATIVFGLLVYGFGGYLVYKNGGIKKNLPFSFSLMLFSLYHWITPFYFYFSGRKTIWEEGPGNRHVGVDITDYYLTGINYYTLANLFFIIGYLIITNKNTVTTFIQESAKKIQLHKWAIVISFFICFGIVWFNFLRGGLNPFLVLFGDNEEIVWGKVATSNYLKNFTDSIIAIIIMGYFYKVNKAVLYPMTILGFILFAIIGFRYRIILTIFGIIFIGIYKSRPSRFKLFRNIALSLVFLYGMFFITYNRFVFTTGNWGKLIANPAKFEYNMFFEQTRGMLDDITVIKYYDTQLNPRHDYGITFLYFFIRMMPRSIVGDEFKDSFYPFPAFTIFVEAYDINKYWGKTNTGEAPLHLAYFYIAGGLPILLFGSFLIGMIIKVIQINFNPVNAPKTILLILFTAGLFQWYTRGYFPGFVDHMAFMLIGFFMVRFIARRLPVEFSRTFA